MKLKGIMTKALLGGGLALLLVFSLSSQAAADPITEIVECAKGDTVADALDDIAEKTEPVTIIIEGVCIEAVTITRDNVTLQGASPGDGLQLFSTTDPVLTLDMVNRIFLDSLTITGGSRGILAVGAHFSATNVTVQGADRYNIQARRSSSGHLIDSTVKDSGFDGISSISSSGIVMRNTVLQDSFRDGLTANSGGNITLTEGSVVRGSGRFGGFTSTSGSIILTDGALVEQNDSHGIFVDAGGSVGVGSVSGPGGGQNNEGRGLVVVNGGSAELVFGGVVSNNKQGGILIRGGKVQIFSGSSVDSNGVLTNGDGMLLVGGGTTEINNSIIRNNGGNGVRIIDTSMVRFNGGNSQIINNGAWGIFCDTHPDALARLWSFGPIGTVSGNPSGDTNCLGNFSIIP